MNRLDLYTTIHKGVRRALFETSQTVSATDFADQQQAAATCREIQRLLRFLDEHAVHEDDVIMPELAKLAPELFVDLRAEHAKSDGMQREVAAIVARLEHSTECERVSLGKRLEDRLPRLVAAHLVHMASEESDANRVLWAHYDDARLADLQSRIVTSIEPQRLSEWYALVLPALNLRERRGMLGAMLSGMPLELFEQVTTAARAELGEAQWFEVVRSIAG